MRSELWMEIRNDRLKGLSYVNIAKKYNIDRRTAKKYALDHKKPSYVYKNPRKRKIDAYTLYIDELLYEAPYSAVRIKELIEEHYGVSISYTAVQQHVKQTKTALHKKATVRFETMPGLQAQVDWGFFENYKVVDESGDEKKLYCFLMILGYSRMRYIEFVTDMTTSTLIRCHINAFRYFNGYPQEILYDNMKQVVIKRLLRQKDSELNKEFEDFAGFYKFKPILCRPYRGQTKGKVERTVRYVRENFMVGIRYKDLIDLNHQAYQWCDKVNQKTHATTLEVPKIRLLEERLSPMIREYIVEKNNIRKVEKDCLISYKDNKYSVPPAYIYRYVIVATLGHILRIYCDGSNIATHPLSQSKRQMIISKAHYDLLSPHSEQSEKNRIYNEHSFDEHIHLKDLGVYDDE